MKLITAVGASILLFSLTGCATSGNYKLYGKCSGLPAKQDCEIGGEVSGTWGGDKKIFSAAERLLVATSVADAAQFSIDVTGSTISYPSSGTATVFLKSSASGAVIASRDFTWRRSGSLLKLADPDAVNSWAISNGNGADTMAYKLKAFPLVSGYGEQRIVTKSLYEGIETASSSSSFYRCSTYPSPYQCSQQ